MTTERDSLLDAREPQACICLSPQACGAAGECQHPGRQSIAEADAAYVLEWLRQSHAPENIIGLQSRVLSVLEAS